MIPRWEDITVGYRITQYEQGLNYLLDGEIKKYPQGSDVLSPITINHQGINRRIKVGQIPMLTEKEAAYALKAADKAFDKGRGKWPQLSVYERIEHIKEFKRQISNQEKEFALLEMWEIAKSYQACLDEFQRTMKYIDDTIEALQQMEKESGVINRIENFIAQIRRCPLGITLCMGPYNYPLNETFAMLIPSLIMGNTLVVKPPRYGSLCTIPFMDAFAGCFPPGVVNIINGDGSTIISPIIKSGQITVLGFIGSMQVANQIISQHPHYNRLRTILGLEAKNPAFVFPDADLKLAVKECISGALEFNGQRCTAIKHIVVHESIADAFLAEMSAQITDVKCGMPWEEDVVITPLAEENKTEWLTQLIDDAVNKGARVVNSGGGETKGNIFHPAVLYPVTREMKIYQVEQFGPIIPISYFSSMEELGDYLADSDYGQQASIFSQSSGEAAPLIDILVNQVSRINLNSQCRRSPDALPFTGRKNSAEGTLSITDALRSFSIRSLVVANEQGQDLFLSIIASNKSRFLRI